MILTAEDSASDAITVLVIVLAIVAFVVIIGPFIYDAWSEGQKYGGIREARRQRALEQKIYEECNHVWVDAKDQSHMCHGQYCGHTVKECTSTCKTITTIGFSVEECR